LCHPPLKIFLLSLFFSCICVSSLFALGGNPPKRVGTRTSPRYESVSFLVGLFLLPFCFLFPLEDQAIREVPPLLYSMVSFSDAVLFALVLSVVCLLPLLSDRAERSAFYVAGRHSVDAFFEIVTPTCPRVVFYRTSLNRSSLFFFRSVFFCHDQDGLVLSLTCRDCFRASPFFRPKETSSFRFLGLVLLKTCPCFFSSFSSGTFQVFFVDKAFHFSLFDFFFTGCWTEMADL